jgi:hypothetical protein
LGTAPVGRLTVAAAIDWADSPWVSLTKGTACAGQPSRGGFRDMSKREWAIP